MFIRINKEQYQFKCQEPDWITGWNWKNWDQFLHLEPKDFLYKDFLADGWGNLNKIKRQVGIIEAQQYTDNLEKTI